jgi:hypothetical protein
MTRNLHRARLIAACLVAAALAAAVGCEDRAARQAALENAQAQVRRIAEDLDKRTTETGVYIRAKEGEIQEKDPWGTPIQITYSQGGVAETVSVRSAGPDRRFHSRDDVVAQGTTTNFKGVGEGVKKHAEETAANAAKGVVRGTVEGIKDSLKESWPRKKKGDDSQGETSTAEQEAERNPKVGQSN